MKLLVCNCRMCKRGRNKRHCHYSHFDHLILLKKRAARHAAKIDVRLGREPVTHYKMGYTD